MDRQRAGSASTLIVAMMFGLIVTSAMTVDYAYMQLVRTEMRSAVDSAAKAGAEALSRTQSEKTAKNEAVRYAACNSVGGRPFLLDPNDVTIGRVTPTGNGKWNFQAGGTPPNACRVSAKTGDNAPNPAIPLFFSKALSSQSFKPSFQATAGQQDVEVCLCLDRSGSMAYDMGGFDWLPPNNPTPGLPHPTLSRWAALLRSVDVFLETAGKSSTPPRTSLVTWSSDSTVDLGLPALQTRDWKGNSDNVRSKAKEQSSRVNGFTNLSGGLDRAVGVLQGNNNSRFASKVVILVTDGDWNQGRNPINAAYDARAAGISVYCVSMLTRFQSDLQSIATITGGKYYGTSNEAELAAAFDEIARSLPVVLTE